MLVVGRLWQGVQTWDFVLGYARYGGIKQGILDWDGGADSRIVLDRCLKCDGRMVA